MKDSTQLITVCIKNIYSCQEMEYGSTAGSCSTCYPDYYKVENIENTKLNICAKCESS